MKSMRNAGEKKETKQGAKWPKGGGHGGWGEAAGREILWAYGYNSFWKNKERAQQQEGAEQGRRDDEERGTPAPTTEAGEGNTGGGAGVAEEATTTHGTATAALMGGTMWEAGDGRLLASERNERGKVMFITHIWVRKGRTAGGDERSESNHEMGRQRDTRRAEATQHGVRDTSRLGRRDVHMGAVPAWTTQDASTEGSRGRWF